MNVFHRARYSRLDDTEEPSEQPADEVMAAETEAYNAFTREVTNRGVMLGGEALHPTATATTVRVRDGEVLATDGPFAETKEALGGYYLIDCPNLDDAIEAAKRIPSVVRFGHPVEVRPVQELPGS